MFSIQIPQQGFQVPSLNALVLLLYLLISRSSLLQTKSSEQTCLSSWPACSCLIVLALLQSSLTTISEFLADVSDGMYWQEISLSPESCSLWVQYLTSCINKHFKKLNFYPGVNRTPCPLFILSVDLVFLYHRFLWLPCFLLLKTVDIALNNFGNNF